VLFGGGVYGVTYYNDVHIFRLALQPKISIPTDTPHRSIAADLGRLLATGTLTDCVLRGERGEGIAVHRSIVHARCPALRSRLAKAEAEARAQAGADPEAAHSVTIDVSMLFKGVVGCTDGEEVEWGRHVRRWPSALRSFVCYLYTGGIWPADADGEWGCSADMDRPDYGQGQDPSYPQANLGIVLMDRLVFLEKLAKPLCLPMLTLICASEASGILERVQLKSWKHPPTWEMAGLVPAKGAPGAEYEFAHDEYTRIECGASNYKKAIEIKITANDAFRKKKYSEAGELYKRALELAGTVAYTKQFGGLKPCAACVEADIECSHGVPSTDSADAVGLWTTLLSNRAECWLRLGEAKGLASGGYVVTTTSSRKGAPCTSGANSGARAAAVDVGSKYGALGADPGHSKSRSRRDRAEAALEAEAEESGRSLASELGSLLYAAEDDRNSTTAGDAVLRVGETVLRAHRCVLIARSEYFRALFLGDFSEAEIKRSGQGQSAEVELEDVKPRTMQDLLWCLVSHHHLTLTSPHLTLILILIRILIVLT